MTENGRKRCRKTKLVPRDCAEFLDDDLVLQEPPQKKPLLEKIKKEPVDFIPKDSSLQFSVNVEVEDMDGSIPDEDPSDYMKYLFSLSKEAEDPEEPKNLDFADNSLLLEQKLVIPLPEDERHCIVDIKKMQKMLGVLHKKYPEEKEAVMYTRNQWGKAFSEKLPLELKRTPQELLIQGVLERWKEWTAISRSKESPHSYKCYICNNGWWTLAEFTAHITNHLHCKLQLETRQQECSIAAYGNEGFLHKEIEIHGKCLKCAKTYDHHLSNKRHVDSLYYYCNYCDERFQTCKALTKHEGTCHRNPVRVLAISKAGKDFSFSDFSCVVCQTVFMSNPDLKEHMTICHSVRSDEPIVTKIKACSLCEQMFSNFNFHPCLKKNTNYECKHCSAKFHTKQMIDHHTKMWSGVHQCRICAKYLQKSCMAAEHYALHSAHFLSARRCLVCKRVKLFASEAAWAAHRSKYHRRVDHRRPNWDKIIVARIMLEQCMVEPVKRTPKPPTATSSKQSFKLTRGETIPRKAPPSRDGRKYVRVYVPVTNKKAPEEPPSQNTTIAHDDTVTMRTEEPAENNIVRVKVEIDEISQKEVEDSVKALESEKEKFEVIFDDYKVPESSQQIENIKSEDNENVPGSMDYEICQKEIEDSIKSLEYEKEKTEVFDNDIKSEDNEKIAEKSQEIIDNKQMNEMITEDFSDKVIKTEKDDETDNSKSNMVENENGRKDMNNIMEELNEFLDIKPDIIVKEEHMSEEEAAELSSLMSTDISKVFKASSTFAKEVTDNSEVFQLSKTILECSDIKQEDEATELSSLMSTDISKVFQASSTFAEEVTDNSEHSKVFQLSKSILESTNIKKEVKEEPVDDDLVILYSSDDSSSKTTSSKNNSGSSKNPEAVLNLEPEVILKAGYRKRKIYRCSRCDYSGFHREYKEHINNHCNTPPKEFNVESNYKCTKCNKGFPNIKKYSLHFEKHGYRYMSCPQCKTGFDSATKLVAHVNGHMKNQFVRMQLINSPEDTKNCKMYQCKSCGKVENIENWFVHWEKHLELMKEPSKPAENLKVGENGERALNPNSLKEALEALTKPYCSDTIYSKSCIVCNRVFERKNDTKRHLVEHLLEDAYANVLDNLMLKCQICSELYKKPDDYKKHMRDHASLPIYKCGLCNKTFSDSSNFTKHKKVHNLKAFICDICNKKFQAKISLEKHIQIHMETEPITCESCQKVFHDRSFYKRHMRQHHDKTANRYRCMLCREKFTSLREKWDHMWLVHKQRKEEADCPICGVSYRKFNDVKKHAYDVHGKQITVSNLWSLLSKIKYRGERQGGQTQKEVVPAKAAGGVARGGAESSDDDCLLIEEERETLIIYD